MSQFRFQEFDIWKMAIAISDRLFDIADKLEERRLYRFAEQLRGASMSISNNIAEEAGAFSNREFANFLSYARRSTFEIANILIILQRRSFIDSQTCQGYLDELEHLCRKITNFKKSLKN
ncbi:four helix bundle protein [Candidatus Saccharibacteria bacterium]|nr:four helix bundle protein [Calditrichia bacterium]NIV98486.1 four helix bundle protein [Candidatus Saccharibacteria bacterium]NIW77943.1 four helix bundle protein [Calditrichia bacterium]